MQKIMYLSARHIHKPFVVQQNHRMWLRIYTIGYHLFQPSFHSKGIGTKALNLLKKFVTEWGRLRELIIITSIDNIPSQRVALKCGFVQAGAPREDPKGLLFRWKVRTP